MEEVLTLMAEGMKEMSELETDKQGHTFVNRAMMDGRGGSWTQVYQCGCGQVFVAYRPSKKKPILTTVIASPCPLAPASAQAEQPGEGR